MRKPKQAGSRGYEVQSLELGSSGRAPRPKAILLSKTGPVVLTGAYRYGIHAMVEAQGWRA